MKHSLNEVYGDARYIQASTIYNIGIVDNLTLDNRQETLINKQFNHPFIVPLALKLKFGFQHMKLNLLFV